MTSSLTWPLRTLRSAPYIGGRQMATGTPTASVSASLIGIAPGALAGGAVFQRSPADAGAPLSITPETITLTLDGVDFSDAMYVEALKGIACAVPVDLFIEWPSVSSWLITSGKTTWTMARPAPWGLVDYATYTPTALIRDLNGSTTTALTVVTAAPGANEIQVDDTTNSTVVTTADLAAEAGRILELHYHPLRKVRIESVAVSHDYPEIGKRTVELELTEIIEARSSW